MGSHLAIQVCFGDKLGQGKRETGHRGRKEEPEYSRLRNHGVNWKCAEDSEYHLAPSCVDGGDRWGQVGGLE